MKVLIIFPDREALQAWPNQPAIEVIEAELVEAICEHVPELNSVTAKVIARKQK